MANMNLTERIRAIAREEMGKEAEPGGDLDARLEGLEVQIQELKTDFQIAMATQPGESRPGQ